MYKRNSSAPGDRVGGNGATMKTISKNETTSRKASETLRPEYRLDYTKARPDRFAGRGVSKSVVVLLDPGIIAP
jgi:hypothetical protein